MTQTLSAFFELDARVRCLRACVCARSWSGTRVSGGQGSCKETFGSFWLLLRGLRHPVAMDEVRTGFQRLNLEEWNQTLEL